MWLSGIWICSPIRDCSLPRLNESLFLLYFLVEGQNECHHNQESIHDKDHILYWIHIIETDVFKEKELEILQSMFNILLEIFSLTFSEENILSDNPKLVIWFISLCTLCFVIRPWSCASNDWPLKCILEYEIILNITHWPSKILIEKWRKLLFWGKR